jgi:hypothetical protein
VRNKVTREVKALAAGILEDPLVQAKLLEQAQRGRLAPAVMGLLFHYAYGKPKETVALEAAPDLPRLVIVVQPPPHGSAGPVVRTLKPTWAAPDAVPGAARPQSPHSSDAVIATRARRKGLPRSAGVDAPDEGNWPLDSVASFTCR